MFGFFACVSSSSHRERSRRIGIWRYFHIFRSEVLRPGVLSFLVN
jgi:hypothetical protein